MPPLETEGKPLLPGTFDVDVLKHTTVDALVTQTKLSGSLGTILGYTQPEGWHFVILVAVASPGNEAVVPLTKIFLDELMKRAPLIGFQYPPSAPD